MIQSMSYEPGSKLAVLIAERNALAARAEAAEAALRELRENVMLGLGMTADAVAAVDDELADSTIGYLLAGHKELAAALRHMTEERDTISSAWDELHDELTTARAQLATLSHAACPHCGKSLQGEMLLPF